MSETPVDSLLNSYFEQRAAARRNAVNELLESLTERERQLITEAAVMGYVRGSMHPRDEEIPLNADILYAVIASCQAFRDLYPTITGYQPEPEETDDDEPE